MNTNFNDFFEKKYKPLSGISIGRPFFDGVLNDNAVNIPIETLNRHGLITGSTGTGKSRAIQIMIEKLIESGIPVLLSDIKGDMSGFSIAGDYSKISKRSQKLRYDIQAKKYPTNYWGSSKGLINFKIKLADIDYVILAKLLELNSTQESHLGIIYKFARDKNIEIRDLKDLDEIVSYLIKYPDKSIGSSGGSLKVIHRKIINLEHSNFDEFFGEPEFDLDDLLSERINILWLQNYQKQRFNAGNLMAFILYRLYNELPEAGEIKKPRAVVFIDEAHQIFDNANQKLVEMMVIILKQIRSKGVGVIFNTQNADDIPEKILEQLGLKIQFALRAFSQKELKDIRGVVDCFPKTKFYNLREEIKSLETGMAFVSVLNNAGALLSPVKTIIFPPASFMGAPSFEEIKNLNNKILQKKYNQIIKNKPLKLGSSLDDVSISRGGKWQMKRYIEKKEDEKIRRKIRKRNKEIKKFLYLIIIILFFVMIIFFLFLFYKLLSNNGI